MEIRRMNFLYQQWIAGFGVLMLLVQFGLMMGWTSPTLARLTVPGSPLFLDLDQASWVASLINVGRVFGTIIGSILVLTLGCKCTLFVSLWPIALGWLFIIVVEEVVWLYVSRLLLGTGMGMVYSALTVYLGEIAVPEIRGALVAISNVGGGFGSVLSTVLGPYVSMSMAASIYLLLAVLSMFLFYWLPESPHHLIKVGKREKARMSIDWYRNGRDVTEELEAVEKFVGDSSKQSLLEKLKEFKTPAVQKATLQVIILFFFMQICGLSAIVFYMETILKSARSTLFDPASVVVCASGVSILGSLISVGLIDKCGRKFLMVISCLGVCLSMIMLWAHFLCIEMGKDTSGFQWLPVVSMLLFMLAYYLGLVCVPSTILSEVFPSNIKGIAVCIGSLAASATSFANSKTYQPLVDVIGESWVFFTYAVIASTAIPYTILFVKETKGKTLSQIQDELREEK